MIDGRERPLLAGSSRRLTFLNGEFRFQSGRSDDIY